MLPAVRVMAFFGLHSGTFEIISSSGLRDKSKRLNHKGMLMLTWHIDILDKIYSPYIFVEPNAIGLQVLMNLCSLMWDCIVGLVCNYQKCMLFIYGPLVTKTVAKMQSIVVSCFNFLVRLDTL